MSKVWKSDGPETKYLERLFREGKVNATTKPSNIQKKYPIFNGFSSAVFRKNFGLAKDKCSPTPAIYHDNGERTFIDQWNEEEERMEEIDGEKGSPEKIPKMGRPESQQSFHFKQAPIIPCVYTDPDTKIEKCLVVLAVYGGIKGLNVDVVTKDNSVEQTLILTYEWPESMYKVTSMFKIDKDNTVIAHATHPKVLAIESALQLYRANIEDAPIATVEIKLPVEVNSDPKTWTYTANKKAEGNAVIFIDMECLRKDYIISKTEKYIKIE